MAEYINKAKLREAMYHESFEKDSDLQRWDNGCWIRYKLFENVIDSIPTADVQPVKHGRWIFNKPPDDWIMSLYTCDQCSHVEDGKPNYCPNCGADMREER